MILKVYVSAAVFMTQGNYISYMFRLFNSHLQSQDAVHKLGSQCVYISEIIKPDICLEK